MANPRRRRVAAVASFRSVGSSSSNPSPCWRPLDTGAQRPHTRSCRRRSQTLRRGSVAAPGRSGSFESHGLRDARLLALGCSCGSFPNRCPPIVAITFRRAYEAHRSDSSPESRSKPGWPSTPACQRTLVLGGLILFCICG